MVSFDLAIAAADRIVLLGAPFRARGADAGAISGADALANWLRAIEPFTTLNPRDAAAHFTLRPRRIGWARCRITIDRDWLWLAGGEQQQAGGQKGKAHVISSETVWLK